MTLTVLASVQSLMILILKKGGRGNVVRETIQMLKSGAGYGFKEEIVLVFFFLFFFFNKKNILCCDFCFSKMKCI